MQSNMYNVYVYAPTSAFISMGGVGLLKGSLTPARFVYVAGRQTAAGRRALFVLLYDPPSPPQAWRALRRGPALTCKTCASTAPVCCAAGCRAASGALGDWFPHSPQFSSNFP